MWFPSCKIEAYYWRAGHAFIGLSVCVSVCVHACASVCVSLVIWTGGSVESDECVRFVLSSSTALLEQVCCS